MRNNNFHTVKSLAFSKVGTDIRIKGCWNNRVRVVAREREDFLNEGSKDLERLTSSRM